MFFDIPHLMLQAGIKAFPIETGISLVQPGPLTHDGLMFNEQDTNEGNRTIEIIEISVKINFQYLNQHELVGYMN